MPFTRACATPLPHTAPRTRDAPPSEVLLVVMILILILLIVLLIVTSILIILILLIMMIIPHVRRQAKSIQSQFLCLYVLLLALFHTYRPKN